MSEIWFDEDGATVLMTFPGTEVNIFPLLNLNPCYVLGVTVRAETSFGPMLSVPDAEAQEVKITRIASE